MGTTKNCKKGSVCGNSCISKTKKCRKKVSKENSERLNTLAVKNPKTKTYEVEKFIENDNSESYHVSPPLEDNSYGTIKIEQPDKEGFRDISFTINGSHDREGIYVDDIDLKSKIAVARAIRQELTELLSNMPEGTLLSADAYDGDTEEAYKMRLKAYSKAGFSLAPNSKTKMYSIIKDGRPSPYEK